MSNVFVTAKTFNPTTDMAYTKPKVNERGGKSINILNKNTGRSLMLGVPASVTYGASASTFTDGPNSYSFSLQFPRPEAETEEHREFKEMMKTLETKVLNDIFENSKDWLGKTYKGVDYLNDLYTPILKYPKVKGTSEPDMSRDPTIKVKLPIYQNGDHGFAVYEWNGNNKIQGKTPEELIPRGHTISCIIQCGGIWITNGKCGVTWKLWQARVKPYERIDFNSRCLLPSAEQDDDGMSAPAAASSSKYMAPPPSAAPTYTSDGEDEAPPPSEEAAAAPEEHEPTASTAVMEEDTEQEPPTPAPKKRAVKQRTT
jgi:hypothetical protein